MIINDIPSACDNYNCSFTFTESSTPQVLSLTPSSGQGGVEVTLYGSGFTNDVAEISVTIGGSICDVTQANATQITCTAAEHAAGLYVVSVFIEGIGYASIDQSVCFNYLLSVTSVSPGVSSIGGGETITITGEGFFDFASVNVEEIEASRFLDLPWFASGFALPTNDSFDRLCPPVRDMYAQNLSYPYPHLWYSDIMSSLDGNGTNFGFEFEGAFDLSALYSIVSTIYYETDSFVQVGDVPCVIISGSLNIIECVTLPHHPGKVNITVHMLTEEVFVEEQFEYSLNHTALVDSITPSSGPAFGGTQLQIEGFNFLGPDGAPSSVTVHIDSSECEITFLNDTSITCTTQAHAPGIQSIFVKTANGIAVFSDALNTYLDPDVSSDDGSVSGDGGSMSTDSSPTFPLFTYQFSVVEIQPIEGSVLGGTKLTIYGTGLSDGANMEAQVYVGEKSCELLSANATVIECLTPSSSQVHTLYLDDNGFDPGKLL